MGAAGLGALLLALPPRLLRARRVCVEGVEAVVVCDVTGRYAKNNQGAFFRYVPRFVVQW